MDQCDPIDQMVNVTVAAICETSPVVFMEVCRHLGAAVARVFEEKPADWRVGKLEQVMGDALFWDQTARTVGKAVCRKELELLLGMVRVYRQRQHARHGGDDPPLWPLLRIGLVCGRDPAHHACAHWNCMESEVCFGKSPPFAP